MARKHLDAFRNWLFAQQGRRDSIGDFATDLWTEPCRGCFEATTISGLDDHIKGVHRAIDAALKARDTAWREFALTENWKTVA